MNIEVVNKEKFCIIRINDIVTQDTDLTSLKHEAQSQVNCGNVHIALSFTKDSNFYSRTIAVIVQILGLVKEFGGGLAIVHPNSDMLEMIQLVGLGKIIEMYTSEDVVTF